MLICFSGTRSCENFKWRYLTLNFKQKHLSSKKLLDFVDEMAKAALIFIPFVMHTAAQKISCLQ